MDTLLYVVVFLLHDHLQGAHLVSALHRSRDL
jgi:hypothetical protein